MTSFNNQRTMSKESSPAPKPKPLERSNNRIAIVFDPVAQRIMIAKVSTLENRKPIKTAPKWFNHLEMYEEREFKHLVAILNLGGLGWTASFRRLCGKCNDIYMMRLPDESTAPITTAA